MRSSHSQMLNLPDVGTMLEHHYSVRDLASLWGVSPDTIVRWFADRPGVLKLQKPSARGRRRVEIRIPLSVAAAGYAERTK